MRTSPSRTISPDCPPAAAPFERFGVISKKRPPGPPTVKELAALVALMRGGCRSGRLKNRLTSVVGAVVAAVSRACVPAVEERPAGASPSPRNRVLPNPTSPAVAPAVKPKNCLRVVIAVMGTVLLVSRARR